MKDNKLIAEFMGVVFHDDENQYYNADGLHIGNTLQYHTSWDWLIPVAQKIIDVYISIDEQDEQELQQSILHDKIDAVYRIVVEIIKTYNAVEVALAQEKYDNEQ
mgnify:FL=1